MVETGGERGDLLGRRAEQLGQLAFDVEDAVAQADDGHAGRLAYGPAVGGQGVGKVEEEGVGAEALDVLGDRHQGGDHAHGT